MNVEVEIQRLVLDGVGVRPADVAQLRTAVATELAALLRATPNEGRQHARRDRAQAAEPVRVGPELLAGIARSVQQAVQGARS